jgi:hypothetical protein
MIDFHSGMGVLCGHAARSASLFMYPVTHALTSSHSRGNTCSYERVRPGRFPAYT